NAVGGRHYGLIADASPVVLVSPDRGPRLMNPPPRFEGEDDSHVEVLSQDDERVLCRRRSRSARPDRQSVLAVLPTSDHPTPSTLDRLAHEYDLRDLLDEGWAVRPLDLVHERGRPILILEDHGGEPLERRVGRPMEI